MRELNVNEIQKVNGGNKKLFWKALKWVAANIGSPAPNRYTGGFHG
ncbi:hypothetical protein [Thalassotalea sediminis]|nr:hypothetical protein [Thalassotalea sediminis]